MATKSLSVPIMSAVAIGVTILLAAIFISAFTTGRVARMNAEQAEAVRIQQENQTFCRGLGFVLGSGAYANCTEGVADIRRRQREKWEMDATGLI
jgi:hypothetical protein